jgi:hypothetical protein
MEVASPRSRDHIHIHGLACAMGGRPQPPPANWTTPSPRTRTAYRTPATGNRQARCAPQPRLAPRIRRQRQQTTKECLAPCALRSLPALGAGARRAQPRAQVPGGRKARGGAKGSGWVLNARADGARARGRRAPRTGAGNSRFQIAVCG